jgi:hypothetical protein
MGTRDSQRPVRCLRPTGFFSIAVTWAARSGVGFKVISWMHAKVTAYSGPRGPARYIVFMYSVTVSLFVSSAVMMICRESAVLEAVKTCEGASEA